MLIDCPFEFLSDCRDVRAAAPLDRDARTKCLIVHMLSCRMMNKACASTLAVLVPTLMRALSGVKSIMIGKTAEGDDP